MRIGWGRWLLLLVALLGTAIPLAAPAAAHAEFTGSTPADGARLASPPAAVTIRFDDVIDPAFLRVSDSRGTRVDRGTALHPDGDREALRVRLRSGLPDGTYVADFRVVSDDGHPVGGEIRFVVGAGPLRGGRASAPSDSGVSAVLDVAHWISWAGFALLGGAWILLTVWRDGQRERRARRLVQAGWLAAIAGAVVELLVQGAYVAGRGLGSVFDWTLISDTLHQDFGALHAVRLALLLLIALLPPRIFFWPLMVTIAYTFSAIGHPRTTRPVWLSLPLDMLHLLAMAGWVGGLVMVLAVVLPKAAGVVPTVVPVFSRVAMAAVPVIAATGAYAAWRGIGSWRAVLGTEYGLLVSAKVLGFLGLLAVGNLARTVIARRSFTANDVEQLRRCVLVETVIAAIVLGLTAVLVSQPRGAEALALAVGGVR